MEIFNKTRKKIVRITMLILFCFVITLTLSIWLLSRYAVTRSNQRLLQNYVLSYSLHSQPGNKPVTTHDDSSKHAKKETFNYTISTFYSVAFSPEGEILSVDNGRNEMENQTTLEEIARSVLSSGKGSGTIDQLMYNIDRRSDYTLVAFIDCAVSNNNLRAIVLIICFVGFFSLIIVYYISHFFAKITIKPLKENSEKQREFISDASHELKTPLAIISANADLLKRQIGESKWMSNICHETEKMNHLIIQLLDLSRAENIVQEKKTIDYSDLILGETLPFESVAHDNGILINMDIEENIFVNGNYNQLCQLVSILLDNAISHSEDGTNIEVKMNRSGHHAVMSVANSGKEIPKEIRSHLFDRFYRIDKVRNSKDGHYGLGLSIAKAIVENHKGEINVACAEGKVIFTVKIRTSKE